MNRIRHHMMIYFAAVLLIQSGCEKSELPDFISEEDPITDIDGNVYKTVNIGNKIWMTDNLNVSHFRNGDPIPQAVSAAEWEFAGSQGKPAWCYYSNDPINASVYCKLYNWYAVDDPRGLEPEGWRVPSSREWDNLINYLDGNNVAGKKLKSRSGWYLEGNGDNSSKFNALPGGGRQADGTFSDIGSAGVWWSSSENSMIFADGFNLIYSDSKELRGTFNKTTGMSVRAVYCPDCTDDTTSGLTFYEKLQRALDMSLESSIGKGVSAAVIMPDGEMWEGSSGISHDETPITPDMLFAIGSAQKMFVGASILQLAEEGKISLDDSLHQWLPPYPNVDSTITIRQLLNHTSGLYNFVDNDEYWQAIFDDPERIWTMEELLLTFNKEPLFEKGTDWHYSQTAYNMLRMIIEKITGCDIPVVNEQRFRNPLELDYSFTSKQGELPVVYAHGWFDMDRDGSYDDFSSFPRNAFVSGIGGEIWSTAGDLARWARKLFYEKRVLSQSSLDQMLTFHSPCTGEEFICAGYGLSVVKFNSQHMGGLDAIGHAGNAPGYAAACIFFPDLKVSLGIVDNSEEGEVIGAGIQNLLDVMLDIQ